MEIRNIAEKIMPKIVGTGKPQGFVNSLRPSKMSVFKNKGQPLTALCPWTLMADEGVCLIKNGALMCAYEFFVPDLDSSPVHKIAAVAQSFNEAWVFLQNATFAGKIAEWLKVLRKKHVFVVFATQELEDAAKSPVASTIISQCASKVYLANEQAATPMMREAYRLFGLDDDEIYLLSKAKKKRDYFFKSALGTRKFQLGLDELQLAVITNPKDGHSLLDEVEARHGRNTGVPLVEEILAAKNVEWKYLMG